MTAGVLSVGGAESVYSREAPLFPPHKPLGKGKGINPGRVVWVYDPKAVLWDGEDDWWKPSNFEHDNVLAMIRAGIKRLTGQTSPEQAWNAIFTWRNVQNKGTGGYKKNQKIAIKPNMNGTRHFFNLDSSHGNAVVLQCLLESLVNDAGVAPDDLLVYDVTRVFPKYMVKLCTERILKGVVFCERHGMGLTEKDESARIDWVGPVEGEPTYFPRCLTEADYLINLATLKGHYWGMSLTAKNHFGSFVNNNAIAAPSAAGLHENIINSVMGGYSVLTDLIARKQINFKTILWMMDALITPINEEDDVTVETTRWRQEPFNGSFVSSLFFSQDPIAIDSVGADFLANEPVLKTYNSNFLNKRSMENYLHESALIQSPPSGKPYTDGFGGRPESLGVHEHWNNERDKKYGRNLGMNEGIELVKEEPSL